MSYGKELILDLHECDPSRFAKIIVAEWFAEVCFTTDMVPVEAHFWEDDGHGAPNLHLNGITAVQFISTSSILIHASTSLREAHINVFTCKDFDPDVVTRLTCSWFDGRLEAHNFLDRP